MAVEGLDQGLSMIVPGRADLVMQAVLALGFRVEEPAERAYFKDLVSSYFPAQKARYVQQGWVHRENAYIRTSRPALVEPRFYSNLHVNRAEAFEWDRRT
jgi:hypothetical protein